MQRRKTIYKIGIGIVIAGLALVAIDAVNHGFQINKSEGTNKTMRIHNYEAKDLKPFKKVNLDLTLASVTILPGDDYHVTVSDTEKHPIKVTVTKDELIATQEHNVHNFNLKNGQQQDYRVTITIPKKDTLSSVTIFENAGNATLTDLHLQKLKLKQNAGNSKLTQVTAQNFAVDNNAGNLSVDSSELTNCDVELNAGNVKIINSKLLKHSYFNLDAGNLALRQADQNASYHLSTNLGTIRCFGQHKHGHLISHGNGQDQVEVDVSMGSIAIS